MKFLFLPTFLLLFFIQSSCTGSDDEISPSPLWELAYSKHETWDYIPKQSMKSRNGASTGYLASMNNNHTNLVIYFEGGGACFNAETCTQNRDHFTAADGEDYADILNQTNFELFDRTNSNNKFQHWSYIFVPYSTGDVHSGNHSEADVPNNGPENQQMVGYSNFTTVLQDIIDYYGTNGITEVLVTGSSAGGYGSYLNVVQVAELFPNTSLTCLIDAAPIFQPNQAVDQCLPTLWDELFQIEFPSDYSRIIENNYESDLQAIYEYLSLKYPNANFGLYSTLEDEVLRYFYGFGKNQCGSSSDMLTGSEFSQALYQLKDSISSFDNWKLFYQPGNSHTILDNPNYNNIVVDGTSFGDWLDQLTEGTASNVIP